VALALFDEIETGSARRQHFDGEIRRAADTARVYLRGVADDRHVRFENSSREVVGQSAFRQANANRSVEVIAADGYTTFGPTKGRLHYVFAHIRFDAKLNKNVPIYDEPGRWRRFQPGG